MRLGLYQVILVFELNEEKSGVWNDDIKHKRYIYIGILYSI